MKVKAFLEELKRNGWKYKDIAEKCNFKPSNISRIINGHEVKIQTIEKIAKAFEMPLSVFLDETRPEKVLTRKEEILLELVKGEAIIDEVIRYAQKEKLYNEVKKRKAA